MNSPLKDIRRNMEMQRSYFKVARSEIGRTNLQLLKSTSLIELLFLGLFICMTPVFFPAWHATYPYWFFLTAAGVVTVIIYVYSMLGKAEYRAVTLLCVLFYVMTMCGSIAVDAFASSNGVATFFQIIIVVLPALFILPFGMMLSMTVMLEVFYIIVLWSSKSPVFAVTDTYSSIAGVICSVIVMAIVSNLRAREGLSKYHYLRQGITDPLTGILNRAECESRMREYFASRQPGEPECAMFMFDIDDFKNVNDMHGHQAGDLALSKVGEVLRNGFRAEDIVGRIGGDEFMVLVKNIRGGDDLREITERIQLGIKSITGLPDGLALTSSLGVASLSGLAAYEDMYRAADQAMYEAKRTSAGQCVIVQAESSAC
jgi:diguanylate cyclase (GGDEF)-like protein